MQKFSVSAPAKINHFLRISAIQPNGLHAIESWMQKISLADTIEVEITPEKPGAPELSLHPDSKFEVPVDRENLILRAIDCFFEKTPPPNLRITLTKNIPIGAGLGGGSSNAAAILRFLETNFPDPQRNIDKLAAELGSDVSFFLEQKPSALVSGTGEKLVPYSAESGVIVLVKPRDLEIKTAWAYRAFDEYPHKQQTKNSNDFEPCIFAHFPQLAKIKRALLDCGAKTAGLSGSGATVFGIFAEEASASAAQKHFDADKDWSFVGRLLD